MQQLSCPDTNPSSSFRKMNGWVSIIRCSSPSHRRYPSGGEECAFHTWWGSRCFAREVRIRFNTYSFAATPKLQSINCPQCNAPMLAYHQVLNRAKGGELFYFCHIHNRMSGRIRIRGLLGCLQNIAFVFQHSACTRPTVVTTQCTQAIAKHNS